MNIEDRVRLKIKHNLYVDWESVCYSHNLSLDFIKEFFDKFNISDLIINQKLSEEFIEEKIIIRSKQYLWQLVTYQKLSENFIRKYKDDIVYWNRVCKFQNISHDFIIEHKDDVSFLTLAIYKKLNKKTVKHILNLPSWQSYAFWIPLCYFKDITCDRSWKTFL
jgi:hypothetical protein